MIYTRQFKLVPSVRNWLQSTTHLWLTVVLMFSFFSGFFQELKIKITKPHLNIPNGSRDGNKYLVSNDLRNAYISIGKVLTAWKS